MKTEEKCCISLSDRPIATDKYWEW